MIQYFGVSKVTLIIQFINPNLSSSLNYQKISNKQQLTCAKKIGQVSAKAGRGDGFNTTPSVAVVKHLRTPPNATSNIIKNDKNTFFIFLLSFNYRFFNNNKNRINLV